MPMSTLKSDTPLLLIGVCHGLMVIHSRAVANLMNEILAVQQPTQSPNRHPKGPVPRGSGEQQNQQNLEPLPGNCPLDPAYRARFHPRSFSHSASLASSAYLHGVLSGLSFASCISTTMSN